MGVPDLDVVYASLFKEGEVCCKLNILVQQPVLQIKDSIVKAAAGENHACQAACKECSKMGWK